MTRALNVYTILMKESNKKSAFGQANKKEKKGKERKGKERKGKDRKDIFGKKT